MKWILKEISRRHLRPSQTWSGGSASLKYVQIQSFYDQMEFTADQCLAIIKAIIDLIDSSETQLLFRNVTWKKKIEDHAFLFFVQEI